MVNRLKINIHPDAIKNFNDKANSILFELEIKTENKKDEGKKFSPDFYISHNISSKDILGEMSHSLVDVSGDESGNAVGWFVGVFDELGVMELGGVTGND